MKKIIAAMTACTIALSSIGVLAALDDIYAYDFEKYGDGEKITDITSQCENGEIIAKDLNGNKVLFNSIDNDGFYNIVKFPVASTEGYIHIISFSFMQCESQNNGTVIAALYGKNKEMLSIESDGKSIVYISDKENIVLVKNYCANVWYDFKLEVNTKENNVSVYVNNECVAERAALLNNSLSIDELRSYSCYSPGYCLDNVKSYISNGVYSATINGTEIISAGVDKAYSYEYKADVRDELSNPVKATIEFSIDGAHDGIETESKESSFVIKIAPDAPEQEFTIVMNVNSGSKIIKKKIRVEKSEPSKIKILGDRTIYCEESGEVKYNYSAEIYDKNENTVSGSVVWSLLDAPQNVTIGRESGALTVTGGVELDKSIIIHAEIENTGVKSDKTIIVIPKELYKRDKQRVDAVKTALDNILHYGTDPYSGTPLIADGLEAATKRPAKWRLPGGEEIAMSNLASQSNLMRCFDMMSYFTGDEKYTNRVDDIYKYYMKYLKSDVNGLFFWGGHTVIDLQDLQRKGEVDGTVHEFKNHMPYLDPLFRLDADQAAEMLKTVWAGHVTDWRSLLFNRHAYYDTPVSLEKTWYNPGQYDSSTVGKLFESSGDMPFRNAANDLMYCAYTIFEKTGDELALQWAERLLDRYNALADPETKIGVYQFIEASMRHDPMKELEPIGAWNKIYPTPTEYTTSGYGDRAKNQFEQQFVDEGIITEDERWKIREAYWISNGSIYKDGPLQDFKIAELFGYDSKEGQKILTAAIEGMASFAKLAYMPEKNSFRYLLSSGIDLTDYVLKTGGYYGDIGDVFTAAEASPGYIITYSKAFEMCGDYPQFADEKKELWNVVRGISKFNGLGEIGINYPGDNSNINLLTSCAEPYMLIGMLNIYKSTGNIDFLNLARRIGDNIVNKHFDGEFFISSQSSKYIRFSDSYMYVLLLLDAEINGISDEIPEFVLCEPYFHCVIEMDSGWQRPKKFDYQVYWPITIPSVYVKEIVLNTDYIELQKGEKYDMGLQIIPSDASNKNIMWSNENSSVADTDGEFIYAYSEGVTELTAVSSDLKAKTKIKVRVK